jgi:hypothetical protein
MAISVYAQPAKKQTAISTLEGFIGSSVRNIARAGVSAPICSHPGVTKANRNSCGSVKKLDSIPSRMLNHFTRKLNRTTYGRSRLALRICVPPRNDRALFHRATRPAKQTALINDSQRPMARGRKFRANGRFVLPACRFGRASNGAVAESFVVSMRR